MQLFKIIEDALSQIEKQINDKESILLFINCKYNDLNLYHFGLGTWIRNNLLQTNSQLYNLFLKAGINSKDDMSLLIINLFYIYLNLSYTENN